MATKTATPMTTAAKDTIAALLAWAAQNPGKISRRGNSRRTVAYIPKGHESYQRFAAGLKPVAADVATSGVFVVEWLEPHSDALSVSGIYLAPSDEMAPRSKVLWAMATEDESPNLAHITRDGGALAKAMAQLW